jgi:hypothetical protein
MDFLEVLDRAAAPPEENRQRFLHLHFLKPDGIDALTPTSITIEGGERVRNIRVVDVSGLVEQENVLVVEVDQAGDFSPYTLRLDPLPDGFDPRLSALEFSFKVECPTEFDCKPERICPPSPSSPPVIDYLAKDYGSFRRIMLDRLAALVPEWQDRNAADLGMVLVELLAYVADRLSYEQDAVATEAYLGTARRRVSVRRHARLVDYFIDDGSNARTWVQIEVDQDLLEIVTDNPDQPVPALPKGTALCTVLPGERVTLNPDDSQTPRRLARADAVFETMYPLPNLYAAHHAMPLYTWSDARCCLPIGATSATLKGHFPHLRGSVSHPVPQPEQEEGLPTHPPGDIVVFEEVKGPRTGAEADADPAHRHAVHLTNVRAFQSNEPQGDEPLIDPVTEERITEIEWAAEDALPFPLCVSSETDESHGRRFVEDVSLVRGNIVLADHGRTIIEEHLGSVPTSGLFYASKPEADRCLPEKSRAVPVRFRPILREGPLTHAASVNPTGPAQAAFVWAAGEAEPGITVAEKTDDDEELPTWTAVRDLLASNGGDRHFVAELESDGTAYLRFGDGRHGTRPDEGTEFRATYRVGQGTSGNIGADSLAHIVTSQPVVGVRNLFPGQGGRQPESLEDVRQRAPYAFRIQQRAVTPKDYEEVTGRHPEVQQAAATFRWTGSWHTAFLTVDRLRGLPIDERFEQRIRRFVERFRMAGYDLEVDAPRFVSLEIELFVCVKPEYFRSEVKAALLQVFSSQRLADGRMGLFHPDRFTFGQTVYLSPLIAAAQAVPGVQSVRALHFQRQDQPDPAPLRAGKLEMARLEIARLDNNPNFPEHGIFSLRMGGGK